MEVELLLLIVAIGSCFFVRTKFGSPLIILGVLFLLDYLYVHFIYEHREANDDLKIVFQRIIYVFIFLVYTFVWILYKHITGGIKSCIKTENTPAAELERIKKEYRRKLWNRVAMFSVYAGGVLFLIFFRHYLGGLPFLLFCLIRLLFPLLTLDVISNVSVWHNGGFLLEIFWFIGIWMSISELIMRKTRKRVWISVFYLALVVLIVWLFIASSISQLKNLYTWQQEEYQIRKGGEAFTEEQNI